MEILVKGDHPIFKRPDKVFKDPELAKEYFNELLEVGYENVEMVPLDADAAKVKKALDENSYMCHDCCETFPESKAAPEGHNACPMCHSHQTFAIE
jgi:formylmethanofuran dehydrogenase subunit E